MNGGLQLTCAVLGTFTKYPRSSIIGHPLSQKDYPGAKKIGFFDSERGYFAVVAEEIGLIRFQDGRNCWCRHPLAFLVEAADDICYAIIDIEDGFELGYLGFADAKQILMNITQGKANLSSVLDERDQIAKLRAVAIGELVDESARVFLDNESALLDGSFSEEIIKKTKFAGEIKEAKDLALRQLYFSERKAKLEIAGQEVICGLLDIFSEMIFDLDAVNYDAAKISARSKRLVRLMRASTPDPKCLYDALLCVTDFVSGMTDRYALELFRTLKGITT
jgi:dGTPase